MIEDFENGTDVIRLVGQKLHPDRPLERLEIQNVSYEGEDAVELTYGDHRILVLGESAASFSEQDFVFV